VAGVDRILIAGGGIAGLCLLERGDQMLRDRYRPLIAAP